MYVHIRNVVYDLNFKKALKKIYILIIIANKNKFNLIESSKFNVIHMCVDCIICLYNSASRFNLFLLSHIINRQKPCWPEGHMRTSP